MPTPVMTVAAECSYPVGDSTARQSCNESIQVTRDDHEGENCESSSMLSADHSLRTLTLMCDGDAGRAQNERRLRIQQHALNLQREGLSLQRRSLIGRVSALVSWAGSFF